MNQQNEGSRDIISGWILAVATVAALVFVA